MKTIEQFAAERGVKLISRRDNSLANVARSVRKNIDDNQYDESELALIPVSQIRVLVDAADEWLTQQRKTIGTELDWVNSFISDLKEAGDSVRFEVTKTETSYKWERLK